MDRQYRAVRGGGPSQQLAVCRDATEVLARGSVVAHSLALPAGLQQPRCAGVLLLRGGGSDLPVPRAAPTEAVEETSLHRILWRGSHVCARNAHQPISQRRDTGSSRWREGPDRDLLPRSEHGRDLALSRPGASAPGVRLIFFSSGYPET